MSGYRRVFACACLICALVALFVFVGRRRPRVTPASVTPANALATDLPAAPKNDAASQQQDASKHPQQAAKDPSSVQAVSIVLAPSSDAEKWTMIDRLRGTEVADSKIDLLYALGIYLAHHPSDAAAVEALKERVTCDREPAVRRAAIRVLLDIWDSQAFQFGLDHVSQEQDAGTRAELVDALGAVLKDHYSRVLSIHAPSEATDSDCARALDLRRKLVESVLERLAQTDPVLRADAERLLRNWRASQTRK